MAMCSLWQQVHRLPSKTAVWTSWEPSLEARPHKAVLFITRVLSLSKAVDSVATKLSKVVAFIMGQGRGASSVARVLSEATKPQNTAVACGIKVCLKWKTTFKSRTI